MATLTFHGAAQQVTGSCYLLDTGADRVLLECGLFQGPPDVDRLNERSFPFDLSSLDAVVLSHAHLDHSGLLPKLVREGYSGKVYTTAPTLDLLDIMLKDAAYLQEKDAEWESRRRLRAGRRAVPPLYTLADAERALAQCRAIPYGEKFSPMPGIEARFRDAGHIIGSAIVELWIGTGGDRRKLVFSGDLGNRYSPLLPPPATIDAADVLLLESTYGDRDHRSMEETLKEFADVLEQAAESGGNVLIPSFAVGRTQEILYRLSELYHAGRLNQQKVFLDSPMAISATEVHERHQKLLDPDALAFLNNAASNPGGFLPPLQYTRSPEESMAINRIRSGAIIIAGSGMCNGGRIVHHLKHGMGDSNNQIIIVGYMAQGSVGRKLVDRHEYIRIHGQDVPLKAQVHTVGGLSAHGDQDDLARWYECFENTPPVYLVHGEDDARDAFAGYLGTRTGATVHRPGPGEVLEIIEGGF